MSAEIEQSIINHNKVLVSVLKQYKELSSKYDLLTPDEIRNGYNTMQEIIEKKCVKSTKGRIILKNV